MSEAESDIPEFDDPDQIGLAEFVEELHGETDRGSALLAAAVLDELLLILLKAHCLEGKASAELLEGATAPLGTFSARIAAAYCFGLLTKDEFKDLHLVRKVRNEFAHRLQGLKFGSNHMSALCGQMRDRRSAESRVAQPKQLPRAAFIHAVISLFMSLMYRPRMAEPLKARLRGWPIHASPEDGEPVYFQRPTT